MNRLPLFWYLFPSYLFALLISLCSVYFIYSYSVSSHSERELSRHLEEVITVVERVVLEGITEENWEYVESRFQEIFRRSPTRLSFILPNGELAATSHRDAYQSDNYLEKDDVQLALNRSIGVSKSFSEEVNEDILFVSHPVIIQDTVRGIIRASHSFNPLNTLFYELWFYGLLLFLALTLCMLIITLFYTRALVRPLKEMKAGAERFAREDFSHRLNTSWISEYAELAHALNIKGKRILSNIKVIQRQRNELETVLKSMREGVVAVDPRERVISINEAAANIFGVDKKKAQGLTIQELVRNIELVELIQEVLENKTPLENEVILHHDDNQYLSAHATVLDKDNKEGALLVLDNVTHVKHLEEIRKEFVSNVSHELRTPITSIQGFVETLLSGAMNEPEELKRFLTIIQKQSDRLHGIIEDLLILSRIEQERESERITFEVTELGEVIRSSHEICAGKAINKDIDISVTGVKDIVMPINALLLEQAIVNLLDNAISYSDPGDSVAIDVKQDDSETTISLIDTGRGISEEHLPRIFERFYRVDKARNRKDGGTGLGLSIVKHIAQAHGGRATVESEIGKGSTFRIHIPLSSDHIQLSKKRA